ncbi:MAG: fatty acid desaturase [Pseudomonadota bacterium]
MEWPTLVLFSLCFSLLGLAVWWLPTVSLWLASPVLIFALVLHASLTHEVCHGHPMPSRKLAELLVHLNPGLAVPYLRFRDTHLAHHKDSILTDPYDDPESNYLDPVVWANMPRWAQMLRRANNTLAGRMTLGPALGQLAFMADDWKLIRAGSGGVLRAWLAHLPMVALTVWAVVLSPMPLWLYFLSCYAALGILRIRTFLEHQAHEKARGRTVIIEDRGLLAFLFLNNNLHVVHHMHPRVPWYRLPALYAKNKARYLASNEGYVYRSYGEIFRQYLWRAKDPVPHPLWSSNDK